MEAISPLLPNNSLKVKSFQHFLLPLAIEVAEKHKLTLAEMLESGRWRPAVAARNEFFYRAVLELDASTYGLGKFSGMHHTTIGFGIGRYCLEYGLKYPVRKGTLPGQTPKIYGLAVKRRKEEVARVYKRAVELGLISTTS